MEELRDETKQKAAVEGRKDSTSRNMQQVLTTYSYCQLFLIKWQQVVMAPEISG